MQEARNRPVAAAIYGIVVGSMMILMWTVFLLTGQVPELESGSFEIFLHLAAELATAVALLVGGALVVAHRNAGPLVLLVALGMLAYTVIVSPGYYVDLREYSFVVMFTVLLVLDVAAIIVTIRRIRPARAPEHRL